MIIYRGITNGGTAYAIDDTCMAERGSEREHEIMEEQRRIATEIITKHKEKTS